MTDGKRHDQFVLYRVGVPVDIGWAVMLVHDDHTVSRTCKGCGVSARTSIETNGCVGEAEIHHRSGCPVWKRLGNNAITS